MNGKFLFPLIALGTVGLMLVYFIVNPSYQKSIQAKYYFEISEYKEAYNLASEAFNLDVYNRMASTIMAQSKTSILYVDYINQAKQYMLEINDIAKKEEISTADRARIKIMSEIVVDSYVKLAPSIITDKKLVKNAANHHDEFEKLLDKVTR